MNAFYVILKNVLIFVGLAIPGVVLAKTKLMGEKESGALSKLLIYVGMPFLVISGISKIEFNGKTVVCLLLAALVSVVYHLVLYLICLSYAKKGDGKTRGMIGFSSIFANSGFLGIPLATAVFGPSLELTCVIVVNVIENVFMNMIGPGLTSGESQTVSIKKLILNPLVVAFAVGIVINLTGLTSAVPETVTYSGYLSSIVTPLSMMVIGIKLGETKFLEIFTDKHTYVVSFFKLIAVPLFIVAVLLAVNLVLPLPKALIVGSFIAFSMPTAGLASTYAKLYGGDEKGAVFYTLGSTAFSIITIPLSYLLLTLLI